MGFRKQMLHTDCWDTRSRGTSSGSLHNLPHNVMPSLLGPSGACRIPCSLRPLDSRELGTSGQKAVASRIIVSSPRCLSAAISFNRVNRVNRHILDYIIAIRTQPRLAVDAAVAHTATATALSDGLRVAAHAHLCMVVGDVP